jgi:hypothetical protein
MAGIEVGLVFALRHGVERGPTWPLTLMAVLAALFLALGVLRYYWDIYRHRTARGISFLFVGLDAMADLTSLISVVFQPELVHGGSQAGKTMTKTAHSSCPSVDQQAFNVGLLNRLGHALICGTKSLVWNVQ